MIFDLADLESAMLALAPPRDGDEVSPGITYHVRDGEGFYDFSPEVVRHIHEAAGCPGCRRCLGG